MTGKLQRHRPETHRDEEHDVELLNRSDVILSRLGLPWSGAMKPRPDGVAAGVVSISTVDRVQSLARLAQEEAGHRLANLLQLVVSNLERTARSVDGEARLALAGAAEQIGTIGRLQGELSGAWVADAPYADHLRSLGRMLDMSVLRPRGHSLSVEVHADMALATLPTGAARCLSQLVAEAVINAAKHAFPTGPGGRVTLRLSSVDGSLACSILDDGSGCGAVLERKDSRGMRLIQDLAQRHGGRCRWVFSRAGTDVQILWPLHGEV